MKIKPKSTNTELRTPDASLPFVRTLGSELIHFKFGDTVVLFMITRSWRSPPSWETHVCVGSEFHTKLFLLSRLLVLLTIVLVLLSPAVLAFNFPGI